MSHTLELVIVDDDPDEHDMIKESLWRNEISFQAVSLYNGQQLVEVLGIKYKTCGASHFLSK